jgi:hypothetical protein
MVYNGNWGTAISFAAIFVLSALGPALFGAVEIVEG